MIQTLKYTHIYMPTIFLVWIGLYLDSISFSSVYINSQWYTNILVILTFGWVYIHVSQQLKYLMLFGVLLAVLGEVLFSLVLGMYTYRLENLPLYIPFGHTLIYAGVYYIVREPLVRKYQEYIIKLLYYFMIAYASAWLVFASDVFGFFCTLTILYIFSKYPHTKLFFLTMYFMVAYLELLGTYYSCWSWPDIWFNLIEFIPSANPPSGISVFYFGFDLGCLWLYKKFFPKKYKRYKIIRQSSLFKKKT